MSSFEPFVDNDMVTVGVRMIVPAIFAQKQRLLLAARIDANSTKAAAFEKECQKIDEDFDFTTTGFKSKTAHTVKCPYKVESIIVIWEVLYYPNGDEELLDLLGNQQFYGILTMELRSFDKPKQRTAGRGRVIGGGAGGGAGGDGGDQMQDDPDL